jgi:hypothetical protein
VQRAEYAARKLKQRRRAAARKMHYRRKLRWTSRRKS